MKRSGSKSAALAEADFPPRVASRILASAADLALILDRDGIIQEVSLGEGLEAHRGWNELVGARWSDTVTLECVTKVEQLVRDALAGKAPRSREINQNAEGVGEIPFRFSAVLLDQQRLAVLGRDLRPISVLQQRMVGTQQAMDREFARLREADTRYRVLFHVAAEGAVVATVGNLRITEANPAAASLLDKPAQALQGLSVFDLFESRSRRAVQALITSVEEGGRPNEVEAVLEGKARKITVAASLFRQAGSALILLRFSPVGAARGAAAAPGRTSQMMAVLDALPDGVVVTGQDRRILSANSAFCDLVESGNEKQVLGQPLERWLGRPGVDLNIIVANLREHSVVRNFATIVRGDFGASREALVTAVSAMDGKVPCLGFTIRPAPPRLALVPAPLPRSIEQLRELVGRVPLKDIVRESADLIERLCIKAALDVSGDNRASAAQLLGLSRQSLYSKLRRHGLGELDDPT